MNKFQTFSEFLATQSLQIPLAEFVINIIFVAVLSIFLAKLYAHYGVSLSNRRAFARNFTLLSMTTMLIITIVKSSLALSLGLVGALSIVRFRAAIKEPEELAYLFLCIAIGLGFGANQRVVTLVAFIMISLFIIMRKRINRVEEKQNLSITVSTTSQNEASFESILDVLKKNCLQLNLRRLDQNKNILEVSFLIEFDNISQLNNLRSALKKLDENIAITFLDNKGLF